MTKTYCDICKAESDKSKLLLIGEYRHSPDRGDYLLEHVCPSCKKKIEDFIKSITK